MNSRQDRTMNMAAASRIPPAQLAMMQRNQMLFGVDHRHFDSASVKKQMQQEQEDATICDMARHIAPAIQDYGYDVYKVKELEFVPVEAAPATEPNVVIFKQEHHHHYYFDGEMAKQVIDKLPALGAMPIAEQQAAPTTIP